MQHEERAAMPCGRRSYCGGVGCPMAQRCAALLRAAAEAKRPAGPPAHGGAPHTARPLASPADIVYLYDGSLPGFLCCVYACVYSRCLPAVISPAEQAQPTLYESVFIETDTEKASRVARSIPERISPRAMELIRKVFLSCLPNKESAMLQFLLLGYREGARTPWLFGHPEVAPLLEAERHLNREIHLYKGFVRFSDYDGVLAAAIRPKNFVLPFLAHHFATRFSNEDFLIYDKTHGAALIFEDKKQRIVPLQGLAFPAAGETEQRTRALWKQFYHTIAITARENPRCRMTHMPKRYWSEMTEMADQL